MENSVVVTFHSGLSFLRLCLESLLRTTGSETEIVVVMNNADERQIDVRLEYERVRTVRVKTNMGYAAAANAGVQAAGGKYVIFSDHDLIFEDGWLPAVRSLHRHSPQVGAASIRVVNPHTLRVLDFGIGFTPLNSPHPHMDQRLDSPLVNRSRRVQAMCCGGLTIERTLFERLGGFDESLGNFYTDIDLCLRLKEQGYECWCAADANCFHFGGDFSLIDRPYKMSAIKADVKGLFRAKNASRLEVDMDRYYRESWQQLVADGLDTIDNTYVACCLMNVGDPHWYVDAIRNHVRIGDTAVLPTGRRDAGMEALYETLGYDFLKLRTPIAYFVDRFISLRDNRLWWRQRADTRDLIVDRNGNIVRAADFWTRDRVD